MENLIDIFKYFDSFKAAIHQRAMRCGLRMHFDVCHCNVNPPDPCEIHIMHDKKKYVTIKNHKKENVNNGGWELKNKKFEINDKKYILENYPCFYTIFIPMHEYRFSLSVHPYLYNNQEIDEIISDYLNKENKMILNLIKMINPYFDINRHSKIGYLGIGHYFQESPINNFIMTYMNVLIEKDIIFPKKKNIFELIDI